MVQRCLPTENSKNISISDFSNTSWIEPYIYKKHPMKVLDAGTTCSYCSNAWSDWLFFGCWIDSISSLTHACILLINNHGSEYKLKLCTKLSSIYIHFSMKVSRILTYQLLQTPLYKRCVYFENHNATGT